jgi:ABC-type molybdenum transport system ATPase subunit/photorepair protein PhrA
LSKLGTIYSPADGDGRPSAEARPENVNAVRVVNLAVKYGSFTAIHGLDLYVNQGEVFAFLGPNGAGKSTTVLSVVIAWGLAYLVFSWLRLWHRRRGARSWPTLDATVESINHAKQRDYTVDIGYSYNVDGSFFSGFVSVPGSWWRILPTHKIVGSAIQVRVNPQNPPESAIVSTSLPGIDVTVCPAYLVDGANSFV